MATIPPYSTRDAARAQRDAYRAQRDYWRMQRRPSVVRPLLLVTIGLVALLIETNRLHWSTFWDWYGRWWPLLLIAIGLLSLGEWWLERDSPYGVRRGTGGLIFWIILLAIFGSSSHFGNWHGMNWQPFNNDDDDLTWHLMGQEHTATAELEQAIPANASLRIQNPRGDVTISASSDNRIHVTARDVVYASSDKDANHQLDRVAPKINVSGAQITLATADINAAHADLTVEVPTDASLDINAGHGDVTVDGAKNNVTVTAGKGDVKLDNISGNVHTHMSKGDFSATTVTGEVVVDGRMDDVSLSGIKNHVSLNGDFFGDTHLQQISGPLNLHSSRTDIVITSVPGNLTLNKENLQFKNVKGPVRVSTRSNDVEASSIEGPTHIENSDADIAVSMAAPLDTVQIHNKNGAIDLTLPATAKFDLDASTGDGDLSTDFEVPQSNNGDRHSANGKVGGGGPTISLVADHGDIHIRRAGTSSPDSENNETPERPEKPERPERPEKPERPEPGMKAPRHLHASPENQPQASVQ